MQISTEYVNEDEKKCAGLAACRERERGERIGAHVLTSTAGCMSLSMRPIRGEQGQSEADMGAESLTRQCMLDSALLRALQSGRSSRV